MRHWMRYVVCAGLALCAANAQAAPDQPNIVVFLVDDMGWQDTSVPFWKERTPFNDHFHTPNIERLAKQGIKSMQARAHPVCSPTRTSILTGQSPVRHHVTNWTLWTDRDPTGRGGRTGPPPGWRLEGVQPGGVTLPALLREAGYFTIHAGKAHWGALGTPGSDPRNLGFDVNIAGHCTGAPGSYQGLDHFRKNPNGPDSEWDVPGLEAYHGQDIHLTDATTIEAKKAVSKAVGDGKPFYLYLAHYAVHTPIQPHKKYLAHYKDRNYDGTDIDIPEQEEDYASMVEGMDASLGEIMDHLEALGVAENTLILFTSDNGGLSAHARGTTPRGTGDDTHCWPAKDGKGSAYEGGTRVPFIAAWAHPAEGNALQAALPIEAGAESQQPLISEDLFPTVLGVAGAAAPEDYPVDGRDLRPYLTQQQADPDRPIYFHYPHKWGPDGPGYEPHSAAIFGDWKIIYFYNGKRWALYNIAEDIGETRDLAREQPDRIAQLATRMKNDFETLGAQWPVDRKTGETEPLQLP
ncbi:MAG: sulfatase-like hydrolase/transferase [Candidatus Hydrogenedens sp.]|nr:sulfatase-like hydrolase/transferase [Candidatus Hydrogenedens sp.]